MAITKHEPNEFRRAIRHLRSGVASPAAARLVTVGTDAAEEELARLEEAWHLGKAKAPYMAFISGDWGFGKTHLRMLIVDSYLRRRRPFIHDHVDGKAGSLAHLHRAVPRWIETLEVCPYVGIRAVVEGAMSDRSKVREWCWGHHTSFSAFLNHAVDGNEWAWNFVAGHQYQSPDYSHFHTKALDILTEAAALTAAMLKTGIVLLLDEAENISRQHDIRGRRKTYATLGSLARRRSLFNIVFVTDRFFQQVQDDIQRGTNEGWASWPEDARSFLGAIPTIPVVKPPRISDLMAKAIVTKVAHIYSKGFDCPAPCGLDEMVLKTWNRAATRSVRLLVRLAIDALDLYMCVDGNRGMAPTPIREESV